MRRPSHRLNGFSILELLCVLGIVGILLTLLVSAVLGVRESSRRISCQSNLHQLGTALHSFVARTGRFPHSGYTTNQRGQFGEAAVLFSAILPDIEEPSKPSLPYVMRNTQFDLPPSTLTCPSSNEFLGYRFNIGSGPKLEGLGDGIVSISLTGVSPAEVRDGLSNTAAISERMSGEANPDGAGRKRFTGIALILESTSESHFEMQCLRQIRPYNLVTDPGLKWRNGETVHTQYNHALPPNSDNWDCYGALNAWYFILPARSMHRGGVNLLIADGAVRWVGSDVDPTAWKAIGTAAGSESTVGFP